MKRSLFVPLVLLILMLGLAAAERALSRIALAQSATAVQAPRFEVDPFWPKPLPNNWVLGSAVGVWVDERDDVWIVHRGTVNLSNDERGLELKTSDCCQAAPPVLAFDRQGNLVRHWGGPGQGYDWPLWNHGISVDHTGAVWIGGNGQGDSHIVKFTREGKFLAQYGKPHARLSGKGAQGQPRYTRNNRDRSSFGLPAKVIVDGTSNEIYVADGYLNRRVAVLDGSSGEMKRMWGAYGKPPNDADLPPYDPAVKPSEFFGASVHCADISNDSLVYVCDRHNDRVQVFRPDGTFISEVFLARTTKAAGSAWDVAFSRDPQQRFLYVADGQNNRIYIVERSTMKLLTSFGTGGRMAGQFFGVHSISVDSQGNIYTVETFEGKRLQKFVYRGLAPVPREHQGTVWPTNQP